jgi:aspartyl-tRNA(Asn)/glutamyl-tRNA(Gln) amidotransferase subunit C
MNAPAPAPLSIEQVRKVAALARLERSAAQLDDDRRRLSAVLGYMDTLRTLPIDGVEPMTGPLELTNVLRADIPGPTIPNEVFMVMAPDKAGPFVRVPRVLGGGEDS